MVAFLATACVSTNNDPDVTYYQEFVTIGASEDGTQVWFNGSEGRYLAESVPNTVDFTKYVGCRALLYFSFSEKLVPGFDKVVNVAALSVANTVYGVKTADTEEQLTAFGSEPVYIEKNDTRLDGEWLDLIVSYYTNSDAKHEFSLVAPAESLIDASVDVPAGYLYLELHQKVDKEFTKSNQKKEILSFHFNDDYNVDVQGYQGIYLKVDNGSASPTFLKITRAQKQ